MTEAIELGDIVVSVTQKDIKNVHLSVHPPTGRVSISAPSRMSVDTIRVYAISKLGWIRQQQYKFKAQERESPREYLDRESHYVWGRRYLLKIARHEAASSVELQHRTLLLRVRPGAEASRMEDSLAEWYRSQIKHAVPPLIGKWEPLMGVKVERFHVQHMKTRWGSCNHRAGSIRLNTELAKKPPECLEYIVIHEMIHLLEPTHNARFAALMDRYLPHSQAYRDMLNRLPVKHERWEY